MKYANRICSPDDSIHVPDPNCPLAERHTPAPRGYVAWHEWAEKMEETHYQVRCKGCDKFQIWKPRPNINEKGWCRGCGCITTDPHRLLCDRCPHALVAKMRNRATPIEGDLLIIDEVLHFFWRGRWRVWSLPR